MAGPHPAVAAIRTAVRRCLRADGSADVLVACSGGADSLALAAAVAFVAPRMGRRAGLVTVDHGLQPGSAQRAAAVAEWGRAYGLTSAVVATVDVAGRPGGPEAAARQARYEALVQVAQQRRAGAVLLGHTREDQAETVLLAMVRGAGPRGLAGMPGRRVVDGVALLRPLLDIGRSQAVAGCAALGLTPWTDPHNDDPAFTRTRARRLLTSLVESLGPGVVTNLARTAALTAADTAALDELAAGAAGPDPDGTLPVAVLAELAGAVRTRVLRRWALDLGVPGGALGHRHLTALDALVVDWHGQGPVHLPGGITVTRRAGRLVPGKASPA
ncbi:MAG: tRNA lysidine(34) synthetase TilS [Micromonosporaceae bacterium]